MDDSISLCMYFGLVCNGTSSLAVVWARLKREQDNALKYIRRKKYATRLFKVLVRLELGGDPTKKDSILHGNSKAPRFQYPNYGNDIVTNRKVIHSTIKKFLHYRLGTEGSKMSVEKQHEELFRRVKTMKGVGPLSFNQLWHSLCISGLLPHHYIESSALSPTSGPAKLIRVFHPDVTTASNLLQILSGVRNEMSKLGFGKVTDFFLENMLCELWRITSSRKLRTASMTAQCLENILLNPSFQTYVKGSSVTRYPDLYFCSPFTGEYQHLFRVVEKTMYMRPSFLDNTVEGSVQLQCTVFYDKDEVCMIEFKGDSLRRSGMTPAEMFIKERKEK